tara:strand:- start:786 stop:1298 length:513 start_codon:yes stop_codon:yes gene_type:complete
MAKYFSTYSENSTSIYAIHADEANKTFHKNVINPESKFYSLSDSDWVKLRNEEDSFDIVNGVIVWKGITSLNGTGKKTSNGSEEAEAPKNSAEGYQANLVSKEDADFQLKNCINVIEMWVNHPDCPTEWSTHLTNLKTINTSNYTWPIAASNWVKALEDQGLSLRGPVEF